FRYLNEVAEDAPFQFETVLHDLYVKVFFAKDVPELGSSVQRLLILSETQANLDFSRRAPRGANNSFGIIIEQLTVDARPFGIYCVQRRVRSHPEQVMHSGIVLGQQRHVGVGTAARHVIRALLGVTPAYSRLVCPVLLTRRKVGL